MTDELMKLEKLEIRKSESYRNEPPNRYIGEVEYQGSRGKMVVILPPEVSEKLLVYLGPLMAQFAQQGAQEIAANIIRSVEDLKTPAIAAPAIEDSTSETTT